MDNKTAYAITEALGEALVRKQEGVDNCIAHIAQLDAVNQRLIAENKKMKEEILSLKSESSTSVKVADMGTWDIAEGVDANEYMKGHIENCCDPDCGEAVGEIKEYDDPLYRRSMSAPIPDCVENIPESVDG